LRVVEGIDCLDQLVCFEQIVGLMKK